MYALFLHNLFHFYLKDWIESDVYVYLRQTVIEFTLRLERSNISKFPTPFQKKYFKGNKAVQKERVIQWFQPTSESKSVLLL